LAASHAAATGNNGDDDGSGNGGRKGRIETVVVTYTAAHS
jgi:hypothetical protein